MVQRGAIPLSLLPGPTMPDLPSLIIVGAGGLGREVAALVEARNADDPSWNLQGFVDDEEDLHGTSIIGYPVLGPIDWLSQRRNVFYALAIGEGETRRKIASRLDDAHAQRTSLRHPSVTVHRTTTVEPGTILCEGAAPTVDVQIGTHVVIDQHCTVGHDSTLAGFVTLHPGSQVSGSVYLETGVTMGAGSVVLPNTRIGARVTVGAGAVVTENLPAGCTAVGVPARPLS